MLTILYFAHIRETVGQSSEQLPQPTGIEDVLSLRRYLAARGGAWQVLLTSKNLRCAINQKMARSDSAIVDGDEVAFFPPVTGG